MSWNRRSGRIEGLYKADKVCAMSYQNVDMVKSSREDVAFMIRRSIQLYES